MKAKKSFGQHFLKSPHVIQKMTALIKHQSTVNHILEVGPGKGILTQAVVGLDMNFKVVELDRDMVAYLLEHQIVSEDQILFNDILKVDFSTLFNGAEFLCIGNFPYNISSKIVIKLVASHAFVPWGLGMFQYEMGKRITGTLGSKDYGSLAILTQSYFDVGMEFKVKPGDFSPPPKVMSAVVSFSRKEVLPSFPYQTLEKLLRSAFAHRRKKLKNNLTLPIYLPLLDQFDIADLRAEQVPIEVYHAMANWVQSNI